MGAKRVAVSNGVTVRQTFFLDSHSIPRKVGSNMNRGSIA